MTAHAEARRGVIKHMWLRFVLCTFVLGIIVDVPPYFFQGSWKVENEVGYFLTSAGHRLLFSLTVGSLLFVLWQVIQKLFGKSNPWQRTILFSFFAPAVCSTLLMTVIGLQLRFFEGYLFPSPFFVSALVEWAFGGSLALFVIGVIWAVAIKFLSMKSESLIARLLRATGEGILTMALVWSVLHVFGIGLPLKYAIFIIVYMAIRVLWIKKRDGKLD